VNLEPYLPELKRIFEQRGVVLAYLFGSQATGRAGPLSDVDFAVLLDQRLPRRANL
jgi:predicted nucleotidyltransferase